MAIIKKPLKKIDSSILKRKHEFFDLMIDDFNFFFDSYEGGKAYLEKADDYLFRHSREKPEDFHNRKKRAYFYNYCRPIIDIYCSYVFKYEIERKSESDMEEMNRFWENIDGGGLSMTDFMRTKGMPLSQALGHIFLVVDTPNFDNNVLSKQEARESNIRPFMNYILPQNVYNWAIDPMGNFIWIIWKENPTPDDDPFSDEEIEDSYKFWNKYFWARYDSDGNLINYGENPIGKVPVVVLKNKESLRYKNMGVSAINDIAYINRGVFNWCSLIDEFLYRQCFNILALSQGKSFKSKKKLGTGNAVLIPKDGLMPKYISPPVEPAKFILTQIDEAIREMQRLAKLEYRETARVQRRSGSGIAKGYDFEDANNTFAAKAFELDKAETKIAGLVWAFLGKDPEDLDVVIKYPKSFDIRSISQEIDVVIKELSLRMGEKYDLHRMQKYIKNHHPNLSHLEKEELFADISKRLKDKYKSEEDSIQEIENTFPSKE